MMFWAWIVCSSDESIVVFFYRNASLGDMSQEYENLSNTDSGSAGPEHPPRRTRLVSCEPLELILFGPSTGLVRAQCL